MPDIIFSYSSLHDTWLSFFAFSISWTSFSFAAMLSTHEHVWWCSHAGSRLEQAGTHAMESVICKCVLTR